MSTNYYFKFRSFNCDAQVLGVDRETSSLIQKKVDELVKDCWKIHIGKRSMGWKPMLQATEFFRSVKEIRSFYERNKDGLIIVNEYNTQMTLQELDEELFQWGSDKNNRTSGVEFYDDEGFAFTSEVFE